MKNNTLLLLRFKLIQIFPIFLVWVFLNPLSKSFIWKPTLNFPEIRQYHILSVNYYIFSKENSKNNLILNYTKKNSVFSSTSPAQGNRMQFGFPDSEIASHNAILWAVLKNVRSMEIRSLVQTLQKQGFRKISITVDSQEVYDCIKEANQIASPSVLVGASTVISTDQVFSVAESGASFISCPHTDCKIIEAAKEAGMLVYSGVVTPSEAFQAIEFGADGLKIFPSQCVPPDALRAMVRVLPKGTPLFISGGVSPNMIGPYLGAGATGFAIGSSMYHSGMTADELKRATDPFLSAMSEFKMKKNV